MKKTRGIPTNVPGTKINKIKGARHEKRDRQRWKEKN